MNRKPINILSDAVPKRKKFSLSDIARKAGIERTKALRILEKLAREGFLLRTGEEKTRPMQGEHGPFRRNPSYKAIAALDARAKKQRPLCDRDKLWRTIRALRTFKRSDLIRLTGGKESTVYNYTRRLAVHGFLKELGRIGKEKVFLLVNDPGPKRPIIAGE